MPALVTLTANDRKATPAAHAFVPNRELESGAFQFLTAGTSGVDREKLTVSSRTTESKDKVRVVLSLPTVVDETVNGISQKKIVRTAYADLSITFDRAATDQERKDLIGILANLLPVSQTALDPVLRGVESFY